MKGAPPYQNKKRIKNFIVQKIVDHVELCNGQFQYLVKWKGWNEKYNTWQLLEDFDSLAPVKRYWRDMGKKNKVPKKRDKPRKKSEDKQ